jgi:hypothetical protein
VHKKFQEIMTKCPLHRRKGEETSSWKVPTNEKRNNIVTLIGVEVVIFYENEILPSFLRFL